MWKEKPCSKYAQGKQDCLRRHVAVCFISKIPEDFLPQLRLCNRQSFSTAGWSSSAAAGGGLINQGRHLTQFCKVYLLGSHNFYFTNSTSIHGFFIFYSWVITIDFIRISLYISSKLHYSANFSLINHHFINIIILLII